MSNPVSRAGKGQLPELQLQYGGYRVQRAERGFNESQDYSSWTSVRGAADINLDVSGPYSIAPIGNMWVYCSLKNALHMAVQTAAGRHTLVSRLGACRGRSGLS